MDGSVLALFLISAFFGGLTTGLAGFAAGLVYSGVWLHILTPTQTVVLIASYGIVNQPPVANAGADQPNVCGLVTTLTGNTAVVGTGTWTKLSGPGTVTAVNVSP